MSVRNFIFMRRHKRACELVQRAARELSIVGLEKRHQRTLATARQLRAELNLPPSPALET